MAENDQSNRSGELDAETPVITFNNVTARVFPLRASLTKLQDFCDAYLNRSPDHWFRPTVPGVMLMAMNYPGMSDSSINLGWVSQHEFMFAVTLEWFERDANGEFQFKDWVVVSPFIFVDDEFSAIGGREMGWPKVLARLQPEINPWMQDPRLARRLIRLDTQMFSHLYAGEPLQDHTLLEIYQYEANTTLQIPPDPSLLFGPMVAGASAVYYNTGNFLSYLAEGLGERLGLPANRKKPEASIGAMARRLGEYLLGGQALTAMTLAQFRASQANAACFQGLVLSKMAMARFHAGGPLGDVAVLRGDPSGGLRVRIQDNPAYPIVESLGLDHRLVSESSESPVTELVPFAPFWMALDLRYVVGGSVTWRAPGTRGWSKPKDPPPSLFVDERLGFENKKILEEAKTDQIFTVPTGEIVPYNTTLGPLSSPIGGPFEFFGLETKVVPIPIRWENARAVSRGARFFLRNLPLIREFSNSKHSPPNVKSFSVRPYPYFPHGEHGEAATVAFLTVNHNEAMSSAANNVGWWATNSVQISLLLRAEIATDAGKPEEKFFLYPVFDFADSPLSAMTGHEVRGIPTALATIEGGRDPWLEQPFAPRPVLDVSAKIFPAVNQGQTVSERSLIQIHQTGPSDPGGLDASRQTEFTQKLSRLMTKRLRLDYLSYKNYISAENPKASNYAGFVAWHSVLGAFGNSDTGPGSFQVDALPELEVSILKQPTYDIARELGMFVDHERLGSDKGDVFAVTKAIEPFRIHGDTRWSLPFDLLWQVVHPLPIYVREGAYDYLVDPPPRPSTQSLAKLLHALNRKELHEPPQDDDE